MTPKVTGGRLNLILILILGLTFISSASFEASAATFADPAFKGVWNRTDQQVSDGRGSRTYIWGPEPFSSAIREDYMEAPGGKRLVQYFDKSRMEINNPNGDKSNPFYVTNGLLARELMSGQLQLGDDMFESRKPAEIGVAGDIDDTSGPTYKTMNGLVKSVPEDIGGLITKVIDREGNKGDSTAEYGKYNIRKTYYEKTTGHNIAGPFWTFLNQSGQVLGSSGQVINGRLFDPVFYATGLPITDAWWAKVKVGGVIKDVLIQAFERRVLTYTPANSPAFQVEMGNVGRHYYLWRYGTGNGTTTTTPPTNTSKVMIHGFSFMPQSISVPKGTTVTWTNMDAATHTVTSNNGVFDSGNLGTGSTFSFTFNKPGTYTYHCNIHPSMTGTVIVTG